MADLILASASPRRRDLLELFGVEFRVALAEVDEAIGGAEAPWDAALRIARAKGERVAGSNPDCYVLSADTVVAYECPGNGGSAVREAANGYRILGKPSGSVEAVEMLEALQGRVHLVCTAFCIFGIARAELIEKVVTTEVKMAPLSSEAISAYVMTGEPLDKAGAYAIQGFGGAFVESIRGSYSNVVGLPIAEVLRELEALGLWSPQCLRKVTK